MSFQEYIQIIRKRGWIIILTTALAAAAAFGVSYMQEDENRATVFVSTVPARPDWGLGNSAKELMRNFAANIQTPEVAQLVIDRAQLDQNPYTFLSNVSVAPESSDFAIKIEARDSDGEVAKLMALTLADEFVDERTAYYAQQDKSDRIEVKIRSRAIGYDQIQPKPIINAVAGAVLGFLLGLAIVLVLTWMEADLLRTPIAVERSLGIPVLGAIPATTGVRESVQPVPNANSVGEPKTV